MRPNGRTIYKVLMKGRVLSFWGWRALVTVRLPVSIFTVPRPSMDYCKEWGAEAFGGWELVRPDGHVEYREITRAYSPSPVAPGWTVRWEGICRVLALKSDPGMFPSVVDQYPIPDEAIEAHKAVDAWKDRYITGAVDAERGPVLDAFLQASGYAKTHYVDIDGEWAYFTYSVKPFYKDRARAFCADLKRAFRVAHEHGVDARLQR